MPQVSLVNLKARGFRSFVDGIDLDFPKTGLMLLDGPSGHGKSSIPLAIAYALDFAPYSATELASWEFLSPPEMQVSLTLEDETGVIATIHRGEKTFLELNGQKIKGAGQIKSELTKFLGVDTEMLRAITYRPQSAPGWFLGQPDAKKKEFLTGVIPLLSEIERQVEVSKSTVKELAAVLPELENYKTMWSSAYETAKETFAKLNAEASDTSLLEVDINELSTTQTALKAQLSTLHASKKEALCSIPEPDNSKVQEIASNVRECLKHIEDLEKLEKANVSAYIEQKSKLSLKIAILSKDAEAASALKTRLAKVLEEIDTIERSVCPTCDQRWLAGKTTLEKLKLEQTEIAKKVVDCDTSLKEVFKYQEILRNLTPPDQNPLLLKLRRTHEKLKTAGTAELESISKARLDGQKFVNEKYDSLIKETTEKAFKIQESISNLTELRNARRLAKQALETQRLRVLEAKTNEDESTKRFLEMSENLNKERDFVEAIGNNGFLGTIFDEILDEIAIETNELLASISNTDRVTISFRSESTTKDGNVDRSIKPVASIHGNDVPLKSGLSGGMFNATNLTVDLSIGSVVSRRTGSFPAWLILDESFDGLSDVPKEDCLEILRIHSQNKLIMVIDHANSFKSLFDCKIYVDFNDGKSTIKGQ